MILAAHWFLYFLIYSFLGWLVEGLRQLHFSKKFGNRGFLIGPICPIYGWGVLAVLLVIGGPAAVNGKILVGTDGGDILGVFLKAILICSVLEYATSWAMEKMFKARWWDYSKWSKFHINGRICLETMIPFGLAGCIIFYLVQPLIVHLVGLLPTALVIILATILFIIFIVDNIISFYVMTKVGRKITHGRQDSTDEVKDEVIKWLHSNSRLYRRIIKAFPNFEVSTKKPKSSRNSKSKGLKAQELKNSEVSKSRSSKKTKQQKSK